MIMIARDVERVRERYYDEHRLSSLHARQHWRDHHAGEDVGVLLARIRELEDENARLRRERDQLRRSAGGDDWGEPGCRCAVTPRPPCSWCTSDDPEEEVTGS